jgi:hypothetical protein
MSKRRSDSGELRSSVTGDLAGPVARRGSRTDAVPAGTRRTFIPLTQRPWVDETRVVAPHPKSISGSRIYSPPATRSVT